MGEWISTTQWSECAQLARPGIIFEIRNNDGQSMYTQCVVSLPPPPFDWKSPPTEFRAIVEPAPQRSDPMPKPSQP
jgi:hypothetical protein